MAECSCSRTGRSECDVAALQRCFERLYSPSGGAQQQANLQGQRSRLPYPLFPLQVQRRWSETAAAEMSGSAVENATRRWSMPWDCRHVSDFLEAPQGNNHKTKLKVPTCQDRNSRALTPDSSWKLSTMASQDGLREAIQLLSCKPGKESFNFLETMTKTLTYVWGRYQTVNSALSSWSTCAWSDFDHL